MKIAWDDQNTFIEALQNTTTWMEHAYSAYAQDERIIVVNIHATLAIDVTYTFSMCSSRPRIHFRCSGVAMV